MPLNRLLMRLGIVAPALLAAMVLDLAHTPPGAAQDGAKLHSYGRHLAQECSGCHRVDGTDNGIPSIIGWDADKFIVTLTFYQAGQRTNPVMVSVASSLDSEQMKALAAYYGSLPRPSPVKK